MQVYESVKGLKVLKAFTDSQTGGDARLLLNDGRSLVFTLYGDCCSSSYFQDEKQLDELIGARILNIEERGGQSKDPLPEGWEQEGA